MTAPHTTPQSIPKLSRSKRWVWYVILFIPFFVAIWVPLYNRIERSEERRVG